jgi:NTE family protein
MSTTRPWLILLALWCGVCLDTASAGHVSASQEIAARCMSDGGTELNAPLCSYDRNPDRGYRASALDPSPLNDRPYIILTFSGGGTRAAAFALGALTALREIKLLDAAQQGKTLLDNVQVISSVSGGSFTAAYYAAFGNQIFGHCTDTRCGDLNKADPFYRKMLYRNIQKELVLKGLWPPTNLLRRSEATADLYSRTVFDGKRYQSLFEPGDTGRPRQPLVVLNSTDISMESRFEFTQDQFDYLCSDLSQLPIGAAVAASAAFPVLLDTIPLRNYGWPTCGYEKPGWLANAMKSYIDNPRRYMKGQYLLSFGESERRYVHLLDGGLVDNIGLRGPLEAVRTGDRPGVGGWRLLEKTNNGDVRRIVIISVDAKTIHRNDWDCCRQPPGFLTQFTVASSVPQSNYSFETLELWREEAALEQALAKANTGAQAFLPEYDDVVVSFDGADEKTRNYLLDLPTTFTLPQSDVDLLVHWGHDIVKSSQTISALCQKWGGCAAQ